MISRFNYGLWAVVIVLCVALYSVKYDAMERERQVTRLAGEIAQERAEIRLLQAEWAVRAEPKRLERLAAKHLILQPVHAEQIISLNDLPPPAMLEPLYAGKVNPPKNVAQAEAPDSGAVLAALEAPKREQHTPVPVALPQTVSATPTVNAPEPAEAPEAEIELQNTPGPIAVPVIPRKRPFTEGR